MDIIAKLIAFYNSASFADWVVAIQALLAGCIAIASMIPGEQPEKFLNSIVSFIARFSRK